MPQGELSWKKGTVRRNPVRQKVSHFYTGSSPFQPRIRQTVKEPTQPRGPWAGTISVLLAASLFATSGTIIKHLVQGYGLQPLTVVAVRITLAALTLFALLGVLDRKLLRIRIRDVPFFLLFGLICVTLFQACWVYTMSLIDVGVATVLNYTAPAWTALFAWPLLGERIDRRKGLALLLTAAGVALIVRIFDAQFLPLNVTGLLWGMGSGVTYGLYGIFGRRALQRYSFWTVITYTFAAGALFLLATQSVGRIRSAFAQPGAVLWLIILTLVPTLGGYVLYTFGLRFLEATVAAILATVEPVMATLWAVIFLGESLTWPQIIGEALVIVGVVALQR
jgi:DME family drug/metabolite transporter